MALPVNIEDLLNKRKLESNRIEFKKGWNPTDIYRSIGAFANDFDNLGGGYILVGVEEERGVAKRPVTGIQPESIDGILKQMVGFNNLIDPYYMPRTSVEDVDGRQILVIWVPSGANRPYAVPSDVLAKEKKFSYFVRSGTSSIVAKGEVLDELREMANRVPFDERPNPDIKPTDISMALLRDYLAQTESRLEPLLFTQPLEQTLEQMDLMSGPTENRMIKNVAAMMFCESPDKFFKYTQVDIVIFPKGRVKGPNNFSETTIKGSVPQLIQGALTYLKNNIIREYVNKQKDVPESIRFFNYPLQALEEAIVNALYHRDYQQYEPVEISVEPEGIHILSFPGPDRTISKSDIDNGNKMVSRRYRNRRLGDFLKEMGLTEGRSTGIPTIQEELVKNGSPRATIETNDERNFINVFIPVHEGCGDIVELNVIKDGTKDGTKSGTKELSERQQLIIELIKENETITIPQIVLKTSLSRRTIIRELTELQSEGYLIRVLGRKNGRWNLADIGGTKDGTKGGTKQHSERQQLIIELIKENGTITIPQLALKTSLSRRTIIRELTELQSKGSLSRVLGRKNGRWNLADIGDTKDGTKDGTKDVVKNVTKQLSERQRIILDLIVENPAITTEEMSQKTGVTSRTIMRDISSLMDMGLLKRQGGRKDGRWILIE